MSRFVVPLALVGVLLLATGSHADDRDVLVGVYDLEGRTRTARYTGTVRIAKKGAGLELTLRRSTGLTIRGPLVKRGRVWAFRGKQGGQGLAQALTRLGSNSAGPAALKARYQVNGSKLFGRWRLEHGRKTVDRGRERLVRRARGFAVRLAVSVDWEGREVSTSNVEAMEALREALPQVPLTQFLNAAYFTKPSARPEEIVALMKRVVLPHDERGLHIHGWRSLIAQSGVAFKSSPSFWGENLPLHPSGDDLGHEVEIGTYSVQELRAIVNTSKSLLAKHGYELGSSFRAGGWMATPNVLHAVRAEGFTVDSSATDNVWHDELRGRRIHGRIKEVWPKVTRRTQPYDISTPAGAVLEMPDTCALADYVTATEMADHINQALERFAADPTQDIYIHIGFHQETAARYVQRVIDAIEKVRKEPNPDLVFETLETSARRLRSSRAKKQQQQQQRRGPLKTEEGLPLPRLR